MKVKDVMTADPACCSPDTNLKEVAQLMVKHDCGEIPVVKNKKPVGVITDRDIVVRTIAKGTNPLDLTAADSMTKPCVTVTPETSIEECGKILETNKIRRVPVIDTDGTCCGIVALADIALRATPAVTSEVVKEVSEPGAAASAAG
ncbi:MAG TPA: CBS domain-containing protein [Pyrinomonadaceae bacterium]|nr:CBS domain-containing protein [Pyrinomonadaceae bacterium]